MDVAELPHFEEALLYGEKTDKININGKPEQKSDIYTGLTSKGISDAAASSEETKEQNKEEEKEEKILRTL